VSYYSHLGVSVIGTSFETSPTGGSRCWRNTQARDNKVKWDVIMLCYISFDIFRKALGHAREHVRYPKPEWLQTISESCSLDET
jgi:hypothetical protein